MNRTTIDEMNELSKRCFGTTSRWKKILDNGVAEPLPDETKVVPNFATKQLESRTFKSHKSVIKRYTFQEVKELMESILKQQEDLQIKIEEASNGKT